MFYFPLQEYCDKLSLTARLFLFVGNLSWKNTTQHTIQLPVRYCEIKPCRWWFIPGSVLHFLPSGSGATSPASAQPWVVPLCSHTWLWADAADFGTRCPSAACGSTDPWGRRAHSLPHSLPVRHTYSKPDGGTERQNVPATLNSFLQKS